MTAPATTAVPPTPLRSRRHPRGRTGDPGWVRPALLLLLTATGTGYLWGLSASGWANAYYSAAAQAMAEDWTAFFFGASDAAGSITVDKPPAALWVMALSVRVFGLSSWSVLVPQALMGVATVALLVLAVRRVAGPAAGLLAGAVLALTPVAVLVFRFNNPDALLVLLLTAAAYALTRAVETASARWLALVGVLVGLAFLTKMLQALLVVPAFAVGYLVAAPTTLGRRVAHLAGAGLALLVSAGWWVAVVESVPASQRPYVGGSRTDSVWELIWGYNGLGRLTGGEIGTVGPAPGFDRSGPGRMFDAAVGGQVAWLLPAALVLLVAGLVVVGRAPRTDVRRAALLGWGGWLLTTGLVFSLMAGIFHEYYTVALAPAIAAVTAIGAALVWRHRERTWARVVLAVVLGGTALWAWVLLARTPDFLPWLRWAVLAGGLVAAAALLLVDRLGRRVVSAVLVAAAAVSLAGPVAYSVQTAATPHTGAIPTAGPAVRGAGTGGVIVQRPGAGPRADGAAPAPQAGGTGGGGSTQTLPGPAGGTSGRLDDGAVSDAVVDLLLEEASRHTWAAATVGSGAAAGYQLATELPVMAIGGFSGTDPSPTLDEFQAHVAAGRIRWFIDGGLGMPGDAGDDAAGRIRQWVRDTFAATTVDGVTLYDLSSPAA